MRKAEIERKVESGGGRKRNRERKKYDKNEVTKKKGKR